MCFAILNNNGHLEYGRWKDVKNKPLAFIDIIYVMDNTFKVGKYREN